MMKGGKLSIHSATVLLVWVGGLNWLIFAIFKTDVGAWIGGMDSIQAKVVYILVGLSAIYEIAMHKHFCKKCAEMMDKKPTGNMPMSGSQM